MFVDLKRVTGKKTFEISSVEKKKDYSDDDVESPSDSDYEIVEDNAIIRNNLIRCSILSN
jgi:hypothetical protein